ncbi:MAG: hypothetical protein EOO59_10100 [Hymenobacter sp.]|nr:MAG: hypothetical protein EOO59_10100 [Hymenobacter sp.]
MKADELLIRQDRVVYTLMVLLAGLGLVWGFWQHKENTAIPDLAPQTHHAATKTPAATTVYVR